MNEDPNPSQLNQQQGHTPPQGHQQQAQGQQQQYQNQQQPYQNHQQQTPSPVPQQQQNQQAQAQSSGMQENVAALLSYTLFGLTGLIFLLLEKENRFVKFHALQSIFVSVPFITLNIIFLIMPLVGWLFNGLLIFLGTGLIVFLCIKAYQKEKYKLPIVGDLAEQYANGTH